MEVSVQLWSKVHCENFKAGSGKVVKNLTEVLGSSTFIQILINIFIFCGVRKVNHY